MRKLNKKRILLGTAVILVLFMAAFYIFTNFVYLPGVHIWWRFWSVNLEKPCYWYDEEEGDVTGESSMVKIKVTGFVLPRNIFPVRRHIMSDFHGEVEIADYLTWKEGSDDYEADFIYLGHPYYGSVFCREHHFSLESMLEEYDNSCILYFPFNASDPEDIIVHVFETTEETFMLKVREGYIADSLEEAKAIRKRGIKPDE